MNPPVSDILDAKQLAFEGDFDTQVENILREVRLTRNEVENLKHLFDDLEGVLQSNWPGCEVHPFGSIVTGLGIKTSDVDCYVSTPNKETVTKSDVILARNSLRRYNHIFAEIFAITNAKVPIVKFLHIPTQCHCDVNFKSPSGVRNSKLIAHLLHMDTRALNLAVLIKYWSKVHHLTGTNLMPNYALTMLVIFYLQQIHILPSVYQLQKDAEPFVVDIWNTAFDDRINNWTRNKDSLYQLLGGFFKYYSTFNFAESIISPFTGCAVNRKAFENYHNIPEEYHRYKWNLMEKFCKAIRLDSLMCVQDPFEHDRNCTVAMYPKLMAKVLAHINFASKSFSEDKHDQFLKVILVNKSYKESIVRVTKVNGRPNMKATRLDHNKVMKNNPKAFKRVLQNRWHMEISKFQRGRR